MAKGYPYYFTRTYELGRWAETGKLAARSRNAKLLLSRSFRRTLREFSSEQWNDVVSGALQRLTELLSVGTNDLEMRQVENAFLSIIGES